MRQSWKWYIIVRSIALLNPCSNCCQSFPLSVDRTWKSERVYYIGNVELAKFTYFSWIYKEIMCHSWKWCDRTFPCVVKSQFTLLSVPSIWDRSDMEIGKVSYLGNVKLTKFIYFSWIYRKLMCHSWKLWIIERSIALLNPSSDCCQFLPYRVDRTWKSGRVSYIV